MRLLRLRFTVRRMMVMVAVVAVLLTGWRWCQSRYFDRLRRERAEFCAKLERKYASEAEFWERKVEEAARIQSLERAVHIRTSSTTDDFVHEMAASSRKLAAYWASMRRRIEQADSPSSSMIEGDLLPKKPQRML